MPFPSLAILKGRESILRPLGDTFYHPDSLHTYVPRVHALACLLWLVLTSIPAIHRPSTTSVCLLVAAGHGPNTPGPTPPKHSSSAVPSATLGGVNLSELVKNYTATYGSCNQACIDEITAAIERSRAEARGDVLNTSTTTTNATSTSTSTSTIKRRMAIGHAVKVRHESFMADFWIAMT